jgi:hypothetical protein
LILLQLQLLIQLRSNSSCLQKTLRRALLKRGSFFV